MQYAVRNRRNEIACGMCFIPAGLCLLALADMPYGYYQFLRFAVCSISVGWIVLLGIKNPAAWSFVVLALLFNPIAPVHMEREEWAIVDVAAALWLAAVGAWAMVAGKQQAAAEVGP